MLKRFRVKFTINVITLLLALGLARSVFADPNCHVNTRCTHAVQFCTALWPCQPRDIGLTCW
jgi:hypothetical protein